MRWLFLLLLLLNVFYFVWQLQPSSSKVVEVDPVTNYRPQQQRLVLFRETPDAARVSQVPIRGEKCWLLGEFKGQAEAAAMVQQLLSRDIPAQLHPVTVEAGTDYWLYLPPAASRQASDRQLRELQSRNIDSYIITIGDLANGISLGIFSRLDLAEARLSRLQDAGYSPRLRELPRSRRQLWVLAGERAGAAGALAAFSSLPGVAPSIQQREVSCKDVAGES